MNYRPDQSADHAHEALLRSLATMEEAHRCAVLWFGDIMKRRLFRVLGYGSMEQYARQELGFSKSRTWDFVRLARRLDELPAVRQAVADGELGYTKAREVVAVATPATEDQWLEVAKQPRRLLVQEIKRARQAAQADPGQGALLPMAPLVVAPPELPVDVRYRLTPEQEARRAALLEKLHKQGAVTDGAELLLEALSALAECRSPRGDARPPVQIHVHRCPDCNRVQAAGRDLGPADADRVACDAAVAEPGVRNTTTIAPRVRRLVLARDRHRCQAPGCRRTRFLEVHHRVLRRRGGSNDPENLITLCASCHRLWHERGGHLAGFSDRVGCDRVDSKSTPKRPNPEADP